MNKKDTVVFDLDGTLLDTLEDLKNSVNYAMRHFDYPERTLDEVRRFVGNGIVLLSRGRFREEKMIRTLKRHLHYLKSITESTVMIRQSHMKGSWSFCIF